MIETAGIALATFFATLSPLNVAAMFAALTSGYSDERRRATALRGTLIATGILVAFALVGEFLLGRLGISLAALRTAGGILLLLIAIDMVFARGSGGTTTTDDENREAASRADISVFPLATPLIAGPGAMGAAILLMANQKGDLAGQSVVLASLLAMLLLSFIALRLAVKIQQWLGVTGMQVIERIMGVLLSALAVQFLFDGIRQSGLLGT
jgi:multiple antibiotic resistance protein